MRSASCCCCVVLLLALFASSAHCQPDSSSSSRVGQGLVIDTPPAQPEQSLGRRGGPQLRAIDDPALLPNCVPSRGVLCSDRDYTGLLKVAPANIDLSDDNYAFAGIDPSFEASAGQESKVGLADGSFSSDLKGSRKGEVKGIAGNEVVTASSEATTTPFGTKLSTRPDLVLPSKLAFTLGKTATKDSLEWRTNKPNFYYVLGQNFGLPVGLQTAADEVVGK